MTIEPEADRAKPVLRQAQDAPVHARWVKNIDSYVRIDSDARDRPMRFG